MLFNSALEYAIRKVQENQEGLKKKEEYQLIVCAGVVNLLCGNISRVKININSLLVSMEAGLEVNAERTKYMFMSREHNANIIAT